MNIVREATFSAPLTPLFNVGAVFSWKALSMIAVTPLPNGRNIAPLAGRSGWFSIPPNIEVGGAGEFYYKSLLRNVHY